MLKLIPLLGLVVNRVNRVNRALQKLANVMFKYVHLCNWCTTTEIDYSRGEGTIIQPCLMGQYYEFMMLFNVRKPTATNMYLSGSCCQQNIYVCDYIEPMTLLLNQWHWYEHQNQNINVKCRVTCTIPGECRKLTCQPHGLIPIHQSRSHTVKPMVLNLMIVKGKNSNNQCSWSLIFYCTLCLFSTTH
jgi:hypothetical protein